ncbi:unnamed protein product [Schistosoma mattheei]|uniref:Uncharacterized protein n=1 Tax=Schistosoma mattheei TaxID=31246 RepID=A0A183NXA2_9TREM|nr:unnamed protein product [Schistosoma mattheei]
MLSNVVAEQNKSNFSSKPRCSPVTFMTSLLVLSLIKLKL